MAEAAEAAEAAAKAAKVAPQEAVADPPPPHISNVEAWGKHPDRNYFIFAVLSVVFGFFGLDHFYLRSFETGFKKLLVNIVGLGIWYVWDVIQVLTEGEKIRKEGLSSPLDWIRGIGHGVFTDPSQKGGEFVAKKSYLIYAALAMFLGCFGLDKFYMGHVWQGIAKLLSCFNIFLFLFGWLWVAWDAFHAFFMTKSVLKDGIAPPIPYSLVFDPIPGEAFKVNTPISETTSAGSLGFFGWIADMFGLPSLYSILPPVPNFAFARNAYKEVVAPLVTVSVIKAIEKASSGSAEIPSLPSLSSLPSLPSLSSLSSKLPPVPTFDSVHGAYKDIVGPLMTVPVVKALQTVSAGVPSVAMPGVPKMTMSAIKQHGGGDSGSAGAGAGPGPVIAGALTAVVLAGGLKGFYDMISSR